MLSLLSQAGSSPQLQHERPGKGPAPVDPVPAHGQLGRRRDELLRPSFKDPEPSQIEIFVKESGQTLEVEVGFLRSWSHHRLGLRPGDEVGTDGPPHRILRGAHSNVEDVAPDARVPTQQVAVVGPPEPGLPVAVEPPADPVGRIGLGNGRLSVEDVHVGHLEPTPGIRILEVLDDVGPPHPVDAPGNEIVVTGTLPIHLAQVGLAPVDAVPGDGVGHLVPEPARRPLFHVGGHVPHLELAGLPVEEDGSPIG